MLVTELTLGHRITFGSFQHLAVIRRDLMPFWRITHRRKPYRTGMPIEITAMHNSKYPVGMHSATANEQSSGLV